MVRGKSNQGTAPSSPQCQWVLAPCEGPLSPPICFSHCAPWLQPSPTQLLTLPFPGTSPEQGPVLLSGNKLHSPLQAAPPFYSCHSIRLWFYLFLTPNMQLELCLFTEGNMEVSGERSRQAGSWGKDSNVRVWDSGQGICLPVKFVKIQNSPSQTSTASSLSSLAKMPVNTSAMKAQLPSISPVHDGGSAEGGTGWHKPIPTVVALSKTLINPILTYKKHRGLRDYCKSGRVKCFQIWSFWNTSQAIYATSQHF